MHDIWANAFKNAFAGYSFSFVFFAFVASLATLFILKNTGLLRRSGKTHQYFVYLYWLYIPAVCLGCASAWSGVGALEHTTLAAIADARPAITNASVEYAASAWRTVADKFRQAPDTPVREMCLTVTREYAAKLMDGFLSSKYTAVLRPIAESIQEGTAQTLATAAESYSIKKTAEAVKMNTESLSSLWRADFIKVLQGGFVAKVIAGQAKRALQPLYFKVKLAFFLLLLPVALEIAYSVRKRRRSVP